MFVLSGRMFISHPTTIKTESIMIMDFFVLFCLFVLEFYSPVNNEVMSSRSVNSGTVPGQA